MWIIGEGWVVCIIVEVLVIMWFAVEAWIVCDVGFLFLLCIVLIVRRGVSYYVDCFGSCGLLCWLFLGFGCMLLCELFWGLWHVMWVIFSGFGCMLLCGLFWVCGLLCGLFLAVWV